VSSDRWDPWLELRCRISAARPLATDRRTRLSGLFLTSHPRHTRHDITHTHFFFDDTMGLNWTDWDGKEGFGVPASPSRPTPFTFLTTHTAFPGVIHLRDIVAQLCVTRHSMEGNEVHDLDTFNERK